MPSWAPQAELRASWAASLARRRSPPCSVVMAVMARCYEASGHGCPTLYRPEPTFDHLSMFNPFGLHVAPRTLATQDRRLGGKSVAAPTGKSFRFVRACDARCLDVERNPDAKTRRDAFPFSLLAPGGFPSSLLPPPSPPNLLSSFSWPYGYVSIYMDENSCGMSKA